MSARDEILARISEATLRSRGRSEPPPRDYRRTSTLSPDALLDRFVERVADYRAVVVVCDEASVEGRIGEALGEGVRVVVPRGLPWTISGATEDSGLSARELDAVDAVVTTSSLGIAETGTIVLTHVAGEGRRALTLVPDLHVCVVRAEQVVPDVPDALPRLDPHLPTTWISGPSATSDIELNRVEGVHGPRRLHVIVVR